MLEFHKPSCYSSVCVSDDSNPKSIIFTQYFPCREENVNTLPTIYFQNIWIWFCHVMINSLCKLVVAVTRVITWVCGEAGEGGGCIVYGPECCGVSVTEAGPGQKWLANPSGPAPKLLCSDQTCIITLSLSLLVCFCRRRATVPRLAPRQVLVTRQRVRSSADWVIRLIYYLFNTAFFTPFLSVISN